MSFPPSDQIATKTDLARLESVLKTDLAQLESRLLWRLGGGGLLALSIATGIILARLPPP